MMFFNDDAPIDEFAFGECDGCRLAPAGADGLCPTCRNDVSRLREAELESKTRCVRRQEEQP